MAKLYPPTISGIIPAFVYNENGTIITVPFSMNRAVSNSEVSGFSLKIKTVNGQVVGTVKNITNAETCINNQEVSFNITNYLTINKSNNAINKEQFYKIQLAYYNNSEVGYYSTVGVVKCIVKPTVTINGLYTNKVNNFNNNIIGVCSYGENSTEKLYSSRFYLYDTDKTTLLYDTGEILHNVSEDVDPDEGREIYTNKYLLEDDKIYYIQYKVITFNNYEASSPKYRIINISNVGPKIDMSIKATLNYDNAYIKLTIDNYSSSVFTGTVIISRASSDENYCWREIKSFTYNAVKIQDWFFNDFSVEHGKTYKYSLQVFNSNNVLYSRIVSNLVTVSFEDIFLTDAERQLKIRFNPKVSTFKTNLLESKSETIGSKYPFIFKNGRVGYKELAISGLISYLMDEEELFLNFEDNVEYLRHATSHQKLPTQNILEGTSTDLTDNNIYKERIFKNEVNEWLQNGKPKLFKSSAEGNYIIRLLNISLSPQDTLGRMLHTFSATAYEIDELNFDNLIKYELLNTDLEESFGKRQTQTTEKRWGTFLFRDYYNGNKEDTAYITIIGEDGIENSAGNTVTSCEGFKISDMIPGTKIMVNGDSIVIGMTGSYNYNQEVTYLAISNTDLQYDGQINYEYSSPISRVGLDEITAYDLIDIPLHQFVGATNLIEEIEDARTKIYLINFLRFRKRECGYLFISYNDYLKIDSSTDLENFDIVNNNIVFYEDMDGNTISNDYNDSQYEERIYRIRILRNQSDESILPYSKYDSNYNEGYWVSAENEKLAPYTNYVLDGKTKTIFKYVENDFIPEEVTNEIDFNNKDYYELIDGKYVYAERYNADTTYYIENDSTDIFKIKINDETIDLNEIEKYYLSSTQNIESVIAGQGIISEANYIKQIWHYNFEENESEIKNALQDYNLYYLYYILFLKYGSQKINYSLVYNDIQEIKETYYNFLEEKSTTTIINEYNGLVNSWTQEALKTQVKNKYSLFIDLLENKKKEIEEIYGVTL